MKTEFSCFYGLLPSAFGEIGFVRCGVGANLTIRRVFLPDTGKPVTERIREAFPGAAKDWRGDDVFLMLRGALAGEAVDLDVEITEFFGLGDFARRVLLATAEIPRGRVMTYRGLAARLGSPRGARAVGNALAGNPVPLVIPCHRVVRTNLDTGGFGGGAVMKRGLLEREGVVFDAQGRVLPEHLLD